VTARFRPLVLCYHAVSDDWPHGLAVSLAALERQLRAALARGYRPGRAADVVDGRSRILHVTFDDAYRNVADAVPVLERLGVHATVFACTAFADRGGAPLAVPELEAEVARHPGELDTMTWDELRAVEERGVAVESHTVSHPHLTQLGDEELRRELVESKERIEAELGRPCRFVAYPYGHDDARVHEAARGARYDAAFALPGSEAPYDRYALPRVGVYRKDTRARFALKASPTIRRVATLALRRQS
jgi:peptidoglycan/xylan/chitin deacetylase (PgdA/CDA1 family)